MLELLPDMMIIYQILLPQISSFLGHFFSTTFITYFQCEILKTNTVLSIFTIFSWICLLIILFTVVGQLVIQKCGSVRLMRELCSVHFISIYFNVNCTTVRQADLKDNLDNRPNGYLLVRSYVSGSFSSWSEFVFFLHLCGGNSWLQKSYVLFEYAQKQTEHRTLERPIRQKKVEMSDILKVKKICS